jgi:hypothetical protein
MADKEIKKDEVVEAKEVKQAEVKKESRPASVPMHAFYRG